jgi:hypothetical protein
MAKYQKYNPRDRARERPWKVHPIWRGIGCLMMIIIPIMAYAGAVVLVQMNLEQGWLPSPAELMQTVTIPYVGSFPHLFAHLLVTLLLSLVGFSVLTALYSLMYRMVGPSQYGPQDAPPGDYRYRGPKRPSR